MSTTNDDSEQLDAILKPIKDALQSWVESELSGTSSYENAIKELEDDFTEAKAAIKALYAPKRISCGDPDCAVLHYAPKTVVGDDELRKQVTDLMGYGGYEPNSKYEQIYEQAKAIVRKRDKPEYQETMHQLADDEFAVLIVDEMMRLIHSYAESLASRREVEARIDEVNALYAQASSDPELVAKLDKIYKARYQNMGGSNVFILERLTALTQSNEEACSEKDKKENKKEIR